MHATKHLAVLLALLVAVFLVLPQVLPALVHAQAGDAGTGLLPSQPPAASGPSCAPSSEEELVALLFACCHIP